MNVIEGEIRSVVHVGNRARVRIGPLTAEVTDASVERLDLTPGSAGRRVVQGDGNEARSLRLTHGKAPLARGFSVAGL